MLLFELCIWGANLILVLANTKNQVKTIYIKATLFNKKKRDRFAIFGL